MQSTTETEGGAELAQLKAKIREMRRRRIALAEPLKARYAELCDEMSQIEREIRALDEDWEPPMARMKR